MLAILLTDICNKKDTTICNNSCLLWHEADLLLTVSANQVQALYIDGLVQLRRNSIALAMELRIYCTNPPKCHST